MRDGDLPQRGPAVYRAAAIESPSHERPANADAGYPAGAAEDRAGISGGASQYTLTDLYRSNAESLNLAGLLERSADISSFLSFLLISAARAF